MKIGIVAFSDFDFSTSTVRRVQMLGKGIAANQNDVHIVVPQRFHSGPHEEERDGITYHWATLTTLGAWRSMTERLRARWATIRLVNRIAAKGLDWLMLYNLGLEGLPLLVSARLHRTQIAVEYCDLRRRPKHPRPEDYARSIWHSLADGLIPRFTDLNIGISRYMEQWLLDKAPRTPTLIVPPLVDTDLFRFQPDEALRFREKWKLGNSPIIAYVGSFWEVEGVAALLRSASALVAAGEPFRLVISGAAVPGCDCVDVRDIVTKMGLDDHVIQTGWMDTGDVIALMSAADVLVSPKTNDIANQAGVATKMAEYLSMGRAVVATRVGDVSLYLQDGVDSLLCSPHDQGELTDSLRRLLSDPAERSRLGKNARRTALRRFDYRSAGRQISAMIQRYR